MRFVNGSRNTVVAERAFNANNLFTRFKGLLGTKSLPAGQGLYLDPCNGIHMFWMTYAIDVVFLDADLKVVACVENIGPWALSKVYKQAKTCLELPVGAIRASGTEIGDSFELQPISVEP